MKCRFNLTIFPLFLTICRIKTQINIENQITIGLITDIHIDLEYDPYGMESDWYYNENKNISRPFGRYGSASPFLLLRSALHKMKYEFELKNNTLKLLFFGGDYSNHRDFNKIEEILDKVTSLTLEIFPEVKVVFNLGNHDAPNDPGADGQEMWFGLYYKKWLETYPPNRPWNTKENKETILEGAYYAIDLEEMRILSVNTNYWKSIELANTAAAEKQFNWLVSNIQECDSMNKQVLIFAHVPFHKTKHFKKFQSVFEEYQEVITLILTCHEHDFQLFSTRREDTYYGGEIANMALSPQEFQYNPGFTIYEFVSRTWQFIPTKMIQYGFNLRETYGLSYTSDLALAYWFQTFDSQLDLGLQTLQSEAIFHFLYSNTFPVRINWGYTAFGNNYTKKMFYYQIMISLFDGSFSLHLFNLRFDGLWNLDIQIY